MASLNINGESFLVDDIFDHNLTVPDCVVANTNKIGNGNGEKKFYVASKDEMRRFFGSEGFAAKCIVMKSDLLKYMADMHEEYLRPTQQYRAKGDMGSLWQKRWEEINRLEDVIEFDMFDQTQISGSRGYVNTELRENKKTIHKGNNRGYRLITDIALPLVSYIKILKLTTPQGAPLYYWKLFADFDAIEDKQEALVYKYGKKKMPDDAEFEFEDENEKDLFDEKKIEVRKARKGQGKYREELLKECWYCPFTRISEPELLIASHIKPWRDCETDEEKLDPKNGFALSPLYDKLFDRGFITFDDSKHISLSNWFSHQTFKIIGLQEGQFIQDLPLDIKRQYYLEYHRNHVFQG